MDARYVVIVYFGLNPASAVTVVYKSCLLSLHAQRNAKIRTILTLIRPTESDLQEIEAKMSLIYRKSAKIIRNQA